MNTFKIKITTEKIENDDRTQRMFEPTKAHNDMSQRNSKAHVKLALLCYASPYKVLVSHGNLLPYYGTSSLRRYRTVPDWTSLLLASEWRKGCKLG
jgi:hypothetical protein